MNLPRFSVQRPVTVMMLFLGLVLIGAVALMQVPVDLMPEMDLPTISVITAYEGAAPEDVEEKVTEPLEKELNVVPELEHITSISKEGISIITLSFEWGTDIDTRANEVRDAIGWAKWELPDEADEPRVQKFDVSQFPVLVYGVSAGRSYPGLDDILEDQVAEPLERLPGVGSVLAWAPMKRQVNIRLDRERLVAHGLSPLDVAHIVERENQDTPAGDISIGLKDYLVRVPGEFERIAPMRDIVLRSDGPRVVRLADVATVEDGFAELRRQVTVNARQGAVIIVNKQSEANTVEVAAAVRARMAELRKDLPPDVEVLNIMDSSEDIERTVNDLSLTLLQGGILAMGVVLVFLRRWRAAVVVGITIPFSLVMAVIAVYFLDYTINMMTLFAMIVAVGMIVDNAIVILENITRHREEGERASEAATFGASEVAMAVAASTATTVSIFFPLVFVKGLTRIMFAEFAVIVCVVLVGSLISAVVLTPMLTTKLMGRERRRGGLYQAGERAFDALASGYSRLLGWALSHRLVVLLLTAVVFGASLLLVPTLGREFMPEEDRAMLQGSVHLPVGTRVEETARVMAEFEEILRQEIEDSALIASYTRCGSDPSEGGDVMGEEGSHIGAYAVKLVPRVERERHVKEIAEGIRKRVNARIAELGIVKYSVETGDVMSQLIMGGEKPLTVNILGEDMEATDRLAERIKDIAERTPGTVDIQISRVSGKPELWVNVQRPKASDQGLNVSDVGDVMRAGIQGREAGKYRIRGDEYDILVRLREEDRTHLGDVGEMPLAARAGFIRTENIAEITREYGPLEIERKDKTRVVNVMGNVSGRSLGEVVSEIEAEIDKLSVPPGIEVQMAGQTEQQRKAFFWLTLALGVGVALIYMVMASQFESLLHPFVVMFAVPFAFTGTFLAIFLGGHNVSVIVLLGLMMLVGIVVNNAIVLVDYTNVLRARGRGVVEAVREAGRTRLRPVLMTALTTMVALLPMAFGRGQGAEVWNPLGLTVLGGLLSSTVVTLVLVPTIYSLLARFDRRTKRQEASA